MTSAAMGVATSTREPEDSELESELKKIAEDALQGLQYAFLAAATRPQQPFQDGSVEESFRQAILSRKPDRQSVFTSQAVAIAQEPEEQRRSQFGRYATQSVSEFAQVGFRARAAQLPRLQLDGVRLKSQLEALKPSPPQPVFEPASEDTSPGPATPFADIAILRAATAGIPQNPVRTIAFHITQVRCRETTSGAGSDEVLLGGLAIDEAGNTAKVEPFMVSNDFDDGEVKNYGDPGRVFHRFDATKATPFPKAYAVVLIFAEEDHGGFASFLADAWKEAAPTIKKKIEEALTELGSTFGPIGAFVGKVLGKVVGWVAEKLVGWIINGFKDDISLPITIVAPQLSSAIGSTYYNSSGWTNFESARGEWYARWDGGHYRLKGRWVVTVPGFIPAHQSSHNYISVYRSGEDGYALWVAEWPQFVSKWEELSKAGLRLVDIETYTEGNSRVFAGTFRAGRDGYALWGGADWNSFNAKWTALSKEGLRLVSMKTYFEGSKRLYVGVFRSGNDAHAMWSGLEWNAFTAKWDEASKSGLRLIEVSSYVDGGKRYFNGVFRAGNDGYALWGSDWTSFVAKWKEFSAAGLRLVDLHAYREGGKLGVVGVYRSGGDSYHLWNSDWNGTLLKWQELSRNGMRLIDLAAY